MDCFIEFLYVAVTRHQHAVVIYGSDGVSKEDLLLQAERNVRFRPRQWSNYCLHYKNSSLISQTSEDHQRTKEGWDLFWNKLSSILNDWILPCGNNDISLDIWFSLYKKWNLADLYKITFSHLTADRSAFLHFLQDFNSKSENLPYFDSCYKYSRYIVK